MGRAIVRRPLVYLMDEPLSNLDAKLRVQTRTELAELQARLAVTTVYVTHDQVEAMTMGHRVAVLRGRDPPAVRHAARAVPHARQPVRRRLHRLAGDEPGDHVAVGVAGRCSAAWPCRSARGRRRDRRVGRRSRGAGLPARGGARRSGDAAAEVPATIRVVEDLGAEVFVHVVVAHEGGRCRSSARCRPRSEERPATPCDPPRRRGAPLRPRGPRRHVTRDIDHGAGLTVRTR